MDRFYMDLVTVTGYNSVQQLLCPNIGMDSFEIECWFQYWKENLFGPFANNYLLSQVAGSSAHAFAGGSWRVDKYMLKLQESLPTYAAVDEQAVAFEVMSVFGGIDKAKQWRENSANN